MDCSLENSGPEFEQGDGQHYALALSTEGYGGVGRRHRVYVVRRLRDLE